MVFNPIYFVYNFSFRMDFLAERWTKIYFEERFVLQRAISEKDET